MRSSEVQFNGRENGLKTLSVTIKKGGISNHSRSRDGIIKFFHYATNFLTKTIFSSHYLV